MKKPQCKGKPVILSLQIFFVQIMLIKNICKLNIVKNEHFYRFFNFRLANLKCLEQSSVLHRLV
jgi:hypothetical protein